MALPVLPDAITERLRDRLQHAVEIACLHGRAASRNDEDAVISAVLDSCLRTLSDLSMPHAPSPWLKIPPEILGIISRLLLSDGVCYLLPVAEVCRSWRDIVVQDHLLWTNCDLSTNAPDKKCNCGLCNDYETECEDSTELGRSLAILGLFFQRSGGLLLSVRLSIAHDKPHSLVFSDLVQLLSKASEHIEKISFDFDTGRGLKAFLRRLRAFPTVREMTINVNYEERLSISSLRFPTLPALQKLSLTSSITWGGDVTGFLTVQELETHIIDLHDFERIARCCPRLSILNATIDASQGLGQLTDATWDRAAKIMGTLTSLSISYSKSESWSTADSLRLVKHAVCVQRIAFNFHSEGDETDIDALDILEHLEGRVELQLSIGYWFEVQATDIAGRVRRIEVRTNQDLLPAFKGKAEEFLARRGRKSDV